MEVKGLIFVCKISFVLMQFDDLVSCATILIFVCEISLASLLQLNISGK